MKVSIVIPCYNGEATVAEAVDSALAQTWPDCEVIVVDDGSTDGSRRVLEAYGDRIKLLTGPNRGGPAARNRGVAAAEGDYIQFLDADDLLKPDKVKTCMEAIGTLPEHTIPATDWEYETLGSSSPPRQLSFPAPRKDLLAAVLKAPLIISAPLHRRATFLEVGGFREHLKCAQEKDLHLRLVAAGCHFHRIPCVGVVVRQMAGSVSSNSTKVLLQRLDVYRNLAGILEGTTRLPGWREDLAASLTRDAFDLCYAGRLQAALKNIELATELDPRTKGSAGLYSGTSRLLVRVFGPVIGARIYHALKHGLRAEQGTGQ